jgi:hypothetical protein
MKPHITDHPRHQTPTRTAQYMALARAEMPSAATLKLQSRPEQSSDAQRMAQFLRVARGHTA